jgi:hypothetical protein
MEATVLPFGVWLAAKPESQGAAVSVTSPMITKLGRDFLQRAPASCRTPKVANPRIEGVCMQVLSASGSFRFYFWSSVGLSPYQGTVNKFEASK